MYRRREREAATGLEVSGLLVLQVHAAVWERRSTGERLGADGPPEIHQISWWIWKSEPDQLKHQHPLRILKGLSTNFTLAFLTFPGGFSAKPNHQKITRTWPSVSHGAEPRGRS